VPSPLQTLRKRLNVSVDDLATKLGVPESQVKKWERRWEDIPPITLRDIAVAYDVSVSSILGEECPAEEWGKYPFAVNEPEPLYGTLRLTFLDGHEADFPISQKARESVLSQLGRRCFTACKNRPGSEPWLYFWGLDDRIALARMSCINEVALLSDDERAAPHFAHPEVYRFLVGHPFEDEDDVEVGGPVLSKALSEHYDELGGKEIARQKATHALVVFKEGRELYAACTTPNEVSGFFMLDLSSEAIPNSAFLQIEDSYDYHEAYFVNMDALRFISIPSEAYHRHNNAGDGSDLDFESDGDEETAD